METIEVLNQRLKDYYSTAWDNRPIFRIVFSDDQFEKQLCTHSAAGILLLYPEYREVPKYKQYIQHKYLIERLVAVPSVNENDLTTKTSYEPLFVFEDKNRNPLPPKWEVTQFVIDTVLAAQGQTNLAKYADKNESLEEREAKIKKLEEELFGNETEVGDALAHKQGVAGFHTKVN